LRIRLIILGVILTLASCSKDLDKPTWETNNLIPVAYGDINIASILSEIDYTTDSESNISLIYSNLAYNLTLDTLVTIPDTSLSNTIALPFGVIPPNTTLPLATDTEITQYSVPNNAELKTLILENGALTFAISSTLDEDILMNFMIASATLNGDTLKIEEVVPANSLINVTKSLDGYTLDLTGLNQNSYNTLVSVYSAKTTATSDTLTLSLSDNITYTYSIKDLVPKYASGYFGQFNVNLNEPIDSLGLFANYVSGILSLDDISMDLVVENNLGIDIQSSITKFQTSNSIESETRQLSHDIINNSVNYTRAYDNNGNVTGSTIKHEINSSNSNIHDVLGIIPDVLDLALTINTNPLGNISLSNDFFYADKGFSISLSGEMPLQFGTQALVLKDTLDYDLNLNTETEIEFNGYLKLYITNGLPFSVLPELHIVDAQINIIETLLSKGTLINSAPLVNQASRGVSTSIIKIPIDNNTIKILRNNNRLLIELKVITDNADLVKLNINDKVSFTLVAEINTLIDIN